MITIYLLVTRFAFIKVPKKHNYCISVTKYYCLNTVLYFFFLSIFLFFDFPGKYFSLFAFNLLTNMWLSSREFQPTESYKLIIRNFRIRFRMYRMYCNPLSLCALNYFSINERNVINKKFNLNYLITNYVRNCKLR